MPKVYIVNKSFHDFSDAERFGKLTPLSEGKFPRYNVNQMAREFSEKLANSSSEDYIVLCSLATMNSIACSIFVLKHKRLNLLIWNPSKRCYLERNVEF